MKACYIDVETGGTDPKRSALLQIAMIIEIDGVDVAQENYKLQPMPGDFVSPDALAVNKITTEQIEKDHTPGPLVYSNIVRDLSKHVDKYDPGDKFAFVGYNAIFDDGFLRSFFKKNKDDYYGSFFFWPPIDVAVIAALANAKTRAAFKDFKLTTVAKMMGIDFDESKAHDAMFDIQLTRKVLIKAFQKLRGDLYAKDESRTQKPKLGL